MFLYFEIGLTYINQTPNAYFRFQKYENIQNMQIQRADLCLPEVSWGTGQLNDQCLQTDTGLFIG